MNIRALFSLSLASLIGGAIATSCGFSGEEAANTNSEPLKIGCVDWVGFWPWAIAQEENLFEANGVDVDFEWMLDNTAMKEQLQKPGQLDGACVTLDETLAWTGKPTDLSLILLTDRSISGDQFIATEEIKSIEDLRGKRVAFETGTLADLFVSEVASLKGLTRKDFRVLDFEVGVAVEAFLNEQVDAVYAWPPLSSQALEREGSHILATNQDIDILIAQAMTVERSLVEERPEQLQALVDTWFDAVAFLESEPERAKEIMAGRGDISVEELEKQLQTTEILGVERNRELFQANADATNVYSTADPVIEFLVSSEQLEPEQELDLEAIFESQFVENATAD